MLSSVLCGSRMTGERRAGGGGLGGEGDKRVFFFRTIFGHIISE